LKWLAGRAHPILLLRSGQSEDGHAHGDGEDDQKEEAVKAGFVKETQAWMWCDEVDWKQFRHTFFFLFLRRLLTTVTRLYEIG